MADHRPTEDLAAGVLRPGSEGASAPLDVPLLLAVHRGLRGDLRDLLDRVDNTPVTDRDRWEALCSGWELFAALVHQCFEWERLHVWPLLEAAPEQGSRLPVEATLARTRRRADTIEAIVESSRPVFARLARARDEDAAATLRARVRAACSALEEFLDSEEGEVVPLLAHHVPSQSHPSRPAKLTP